MTDSTPQSDHIIRAARQSLSEQRGGGVHRRTQSIGRGSFKLKSQHWMKKVRNIAIGVFALWIGAAIIGKIIGGLGFTGVMAAGIATLATLVLLGKYPKMKVPQRADLDTENVRQLVAKTELWLEMQRGRLPKPIAASLSVIGRQLDELEPQLAEVDQLHPTAKEIRKLVGQDLPDMIEGFLKIPESLRYEEGGGSTPVKQLENGLDVISREIDSINRQLAQGSIDDLAIRGRYLDYKYGDGIDGENADYGVPLPDFDKQKTAG